MDGTVFTKIDIEEIQKDLVAHGFKANGKEKLYNGCTGEAIDAEIFIAPCYMQRLQRFVNNSVYAVSSGPTDAVTRQPVGGKANNGGLRMGEMERDVLISNGATKFLREKFFTHSDGFDMYVCKRCGGRNSVVVNVERRIYKCVNCRDLADIVLIPSSWSSKMFLQEIEALGIGIKIGVAPSVNEIYE